MDAAFFIYLELSSDLTLVVNKKTIPLVLSREGKVEKTLHGLVEEYLAAAEYERPAILDRINTELLEIEKLKSVRDSLTVDQSFMWAFAQFRRELRGLLWEHGIPNNLGWTDDEIITALKQLTKNKKKKSR